MHSPLEVQDPLADREVVIRMVVHADNAQRHERTVMVTVGVPGEAPVLVSGQFGDVLALVEQGWIHYGTRHAGQAVEPVAVAEVNLIEADELDLPKERDAGAFNERGVSLQQPSSHEVQPPSSPKDSIFSLF